MLGMHLPTEPAIVFTKHTLSTVTVAAKLNAGRRDEAECVGGRTKLNSDKKGSNLVPVKNAANEDALALFLSTTRTKSEHT